MSRQLATIYRRFGEACYLSLQGSPRNVIYLEEMAVLYSTRLTVLGLPGRRG